MSSRYSKVLHFCRIISSNMKNISSPLGFAVIGFGHIGQKHTHHILANTEAEFIGAFDVDDSKKSEIKNNNLPYFDSLYELLNHPKVQIVCICTPNGLHAEHAIASLKAGKHVVIEKPMTLSAEQANHVLETASEFNRFVFCVMQNRYSPVATWLKNVINQSILGEIYSVSVLCAWNRDHRYYKPFHWHGNLNLDGGPLYTQFSHFVDLMYWLFGNIEIGKTEFYNFNHHELTEFEDSGFFTFNSPEQKKMRGLFQYTTSVFHSNFESSIHIIAQKGTIKVGGQYMNEIQYCQIENYTLPELEPTPPPNQYDGYQGSASNHQFVIQNAIDTLKGISSPNTPASEGRDVVQIIETIYKNRIL